MSFSDEQPLIPADFRGVARLFPVPNLVMFPHVMQPLHIFEPRYREMTEDALAGDKLIATAQFEPGWQANYDGRPRLKSFGCLGKIVTHHRMADGRFNLLLAGVARVRIVEELPPARSYREAKVERVEDQFPTGESARIDTLHAELVESFRQALHGFEDAGEHLEPLLDGEIGLGALTDIAAYTLDLPLELKESLLGEPRIDRRAAALLECLRQTAREQRDGRGNFPPDFSAN